MTTTIEEPTSSPGRGTVDASSRPGGEAQPAASHGMSHMRALDGLRGVAVLAVVLYHFAPDVLGGGFLGVDMFFVLSGFLITSLLVGELEAHGHIALKEFWFRRARRLLPALFLVLGVVGAYAVFVADRVPGRHIAEDGLSAFGYFANWHFFSTGQSYTRLILHEAPSPLRHTWSLAIEEQFYLLWPLVVAFVAFLVLAAARRRGRAGTWLRPALAAVCVTLAVASLVRMITMYDPARSADRVYYGTDTRAHLLLIGAALGALTAGSLAVRGRGRRWVLIGAGIVAAVGLVGAMASVDTETSWLYQGGGGVIAIAVVLVLAAAAQPGANPLGWCLKFRPLVGLGLISYGVYLWHWPATVWLTESGTGLDGVALFAVRSVATLAAAIASYRLVEQPIRRGALRRLPKPGRAAIPALSATVIAVVLVVPALAFPAVRSSTHHARPSASSVAVARTYAAAPRCDESLVPGTRPLASRPARVFFAGNSVAKEIEPCLAAILQANGLEVVPRVQSALSSCDFIGPSRDIVANPRTRPDIGILFIGTLTKSSCEDEIPMAEGVHEVVKIWKDAGMRVFLVPQPARALRTDPPEGIPAGLVAEAALDPDVVTYLDAGRYIRDATGVYQWRMPCIPGEADCRPDGTIGVRNPDTGHFCADPSWAIFPCAPRFQGGERRVAAALAEGVLTIVHNEGVAPAQATRAGT